MNNRKILICTKENLSYNNFRLHITRSLDVVSWFKHPPILLQVRLKPTLYKYLPQGPTVRVLLVGANNSKPGSGHLKPTNSLQKLWFTLENILDAYISL